MPLKDDILIGQLLISKGVISPEQLEEGLREQKKTGNFICTTLVKFGFASQEKILSVLSDQLNIPYISLNGRTIEPSVIKRVPAKFISYYKAIPVEFDNGILTIAMSDPLDVRTIDDIRLLLGIEVKAVLSSEPEIRDAIHKYYGVGADTLEEIISQKQPVEEIRLVGEKAENLEEIVDDASIVKFVNQILTEAVRERATDIHFEPFQNELRTRFRIDGILYDVNIPETIKYFHSAIVSRIKIMSQLNIAERRLPQDGALKGQIDKVIIYDGNKRQVSHTLNTYEVKKSGSSDKFLGFPALTEQTTKVYEENGSSLTSKNVFTYDNIGNLLESESSGDISKTGDEKYTSTVYGPAYEISSADGRVWQGFNRPLETTLQDQGRQVVSRKNFEYDARGNLAKETSWLNTQDIGPFTEYGYDDYGNLTSTTNALGSTVTTDYENTFHTYPEKITNSLGHIIRYNYDSKFGIVKSTTDVNGNTSSITYDTLGRTDNVINANGQITTAYAYPDFNTKITWIPDGRSSIENIDGLGRKYQAVSSGEDGANKRDVSTEIYFNNRGLKEKESLSHYVDEDPYQISYIKYEYDIRGRIKKTITDFPGASYDAEASVDYISPLYVETTDPLGHRKGSLKDAYGNTVEIREFTSDGVYKTSYAYDTQGSLIKTTDNQGNISEIFYDSLGRKTKMIDPDMGTWHYDYDLSGNLRKQIDAKGQLLEFDYDQLNRLLKKVSLRGDFSAALKAGSSGKEACFASTETILAQYYYDDTAKPNCIGRLSKVVDKSGSSEFFYDKLGREVKSIKIINGMPYTVERTYDILDRLHTLKYPDGETLTYAYDVNSGLLESIRSTLSATSYVNDIFYNAKGQIKNTQYGNGVITGYDYGKDLRLSRIQTTDDRGQSTLQDLNYLFDKNGNVTSLTDSLRSNTRTYKYDSLDRLTEAHNLPNPSGGYTNYYYRYDSIGNMTYKSDVGTMSYGVVLPDGALSKPHALTSAGGYSYKYDTNGNMIEGKGKYFSYDVENRLVSAYFGQSAEHYHYDGDGGRVKKIPTSGGGTTNTIDYIGSLFEKTTDGKITKHIFAGSNRVASVTQTIAGGLSPEGSAPVVYYYHPDHLGSSNVITDQSGQQVQYCEYTPYGKLARNEGVDAINHKFNGKELDDTGLYFYGARYYNPEIGRFVTADTIVQAPYDPQSLNRYAYCRNNPINYVDPTGHSWFSKWFKKFFADYGSFIPIIGSMLHIVMPIINGLNAMVAASAYTGNWNIMKNLAISTVSAFVMSGFNPIAAGAAYATTTFTESKFGRDTIEYVGNEVFDDAFGMNPRSAYIAASISVNVAFNLVAESVIAEALYDPLKAVPFDPSAHKIEGGSAQGRAYGPSPSSSSSRFEPKYLKALVNRSGQQVGTLGVDRVGFLGLNTKLRFLGINHTGATMAGYSGGTLNPFTYLTNGVCHQGSNLSMLGAGYSSTVTSLGGGGWSTYVSTVIYGYYGGGLSRIGMAYAD